LGGEFDAIALDDRVESVGTLAIARLSLGVRAAHNAARPEKAFLTPDGALTASPHA